MNYIASQEIDLCPSGGVEISRQDSRTRSFKARSQVPVFLVHGTSTNRGELKVVITRNPCDALTWKNDTRKSGPRKHNLINISC